MTALRKGLFAGVLLLLALSSGLRADPCLIVYPDGPCTYHYDPAYYYTVGPGDPLYNPLYDRGGEMLLMVGTNYLDLSIYQAPNLIAFVPAYDANAGYFFDGNDFTLVIDGFSHTPTTYLNILVMFDRFNPSGCTPQISVNGTPITGNSFSAGDLVVSTPTPYGNNYSDTKTVDISWDGCLGMRIWAFADVDYDGMQGVGECFTAFTHDLTAVPVEETTWGSIKELFK